MSAYAPFVNSAGCQLNYESVMWNWHLRKNLLKNKFSFAGN